jgi:uncharacterized RDD family membrane protein YckC
MCATLAGVKAAARWRRTCGWLLDGFVALLVLFVGLLIGVGLSSFFAVVFVVVSLWMYFALLESSPRQATLAKMLLHEQVTDLSGERISFERASARHFSMYLTLLTPFWIGFLMTFWTKRRQALHDYVSSTQVTHAPETRNAGP